MIQIAGVEFGQYKSVTDVFLEACGKYTSKPAFSCMGQSLSFTEMDRLTANFASYLQNHTDLEVGDRIAIQLPNVLQFPIAVFGAMRAGMVVVSTNPLYTSREW
jgi:long-chain acyl-CoA synthetase